MTPLSNAGQRIQDGAQSLRDRVVAARDRLTAKSDEQGNKTTKNVNKTSLNSNDIGSTNQKVWSDKPTLKGVSKAIGLTAFVTMVGRAFKSDGGKAPQATPPNFNSHSVKWSNASDNWSNASFDHSDSSGVTLRERVKQETPRLDQPAKETLQLNQVKQEAHKLDQPKQETTQLNKEVNRIQSNKVDKTNTPEMRSYEQLKGVREEISGLLKQRDNLTREINQPGIAPEYKQKLQADLKTISQQVAALAEPIFDHVGHSVLKEGAMSVKEQQCKQLFEPALIKQIALESIKSDPNIRNVFSSLLTASNLKGNLSLADVMKVLDQDVGAKLKSDFFKGLLDDTSGKSLLTAINSGWVSATTRNESKSQRTILEYVVGTRNFEPAQEKAIRLALKSQDPEAYQQAKVSLYIRAAGHALSLAGTTTESNRVEFFLSKMNKLNQKLSDTGQIDPARMSVLKNVFEFRNTKEQNAYKMMEKIAGGETVLISTGYIGHSIAVVISGDKIVIGNRGGGSDDRRPLEIYTYDPKKLNAAIIADIISLQSVDKANFKGELNRLKEELGCTSSDSDKKLEQFANQQVPMQRSGNCTYANLRAGMFAISLLEAEKRNPNLAADQSNLDILAKENQHLEKFYIDNFVEKMNSKFSLLKSDDHNLGKDIQRVQFASRITFNPIDKKQEAAALYDIIKKMQTEDPVLFKQKLDKFEEEAKTRVYLSTVLKFKGGGEPTETQVKHFGLLQELFLGVNPSRL